MADLDPVRIPTAAPSVVTSASTPRTPRRRWAGVDVTVWLPPGCFDSGRRYPVLYFHDGHNLWDAETAFGGVDWGLDEALSDLAAAGTPVIAVGTACHPTERAREYTPHRSTWPGFAELVGDDGTGSGADHLRFWTDELKPQIDRLFPTSSAAGDTAACGSSAGGVMALYAWTQRPDLFGLAGFSPALHLCGDGVADDVRTALAAGAAGRLHVSVGGQESEDEASRRAYVDRAKELVALLDERPGVALRYCYDSEAPHHESAWRALLPEALRFLLRRD
ncbi:MAG: alpha/beta hydrolase [Micropruina sp.]|nr:MAG: alpha/beta hydrolase [Micropruina sp.]